MKAWIVGLLLALGVVSTAQAQGPYGPCIVGSTTVLGCYKVDGVTITVTNGVITAVAAVGSAAFNTILSGTNTTAAMVVGTGASLGTSGSGSITATAVPVGGISGLGTGVGTFLATPSSANLLSALTTKTGTGTAVFSIAPTITGAPTFTGVPVLSGLSAGTQVSCLGLDSGNNVVLSAAACGSGGSGITSLIVNPGLTTTVGTQNTGTTISSGGSTVSGQTWPVAVASNCTVNSNCNGVVTNETGEVLKCTASSVTLTYPNPASGTKGNSYNIGSDGTHACIITTAGGTATFYGGPGSGSTSYTLPVGATATIVDDGANYLTAVANPSGGTAANPTATAGPAAVNGSASTFMRSDAAPAVQKGSAAQFGIVEVDNTTITASGGVITAVGGSATSVTAGTTTVGGTCPSGDNLYNNGGTLGCQANGGGGGTITQNYITGCTMSNDLGTPNTVLDISNAPCQATDSTNAEFIPSLAASFTKSIASSFTTGSGNGGLGGGLSLTASTWYHVFLIDCSTGGAHGDIYFDTSLSAANIPACATKFRRIGSVFVNASSHIVAFSQNGDEFLYLAPIGDVSGLSVTTTPQLVTLTVPLGLKVGAILRGEAGSANSQVLVNSPDETSVAVQTPSGNSTLVATASFVFMGQANVRTNTSSQVRIVSGATQTMYMATVGYVDQRGKNG